jgi:hypothetical protein
MNVWWNFSELNFNKMCGTVCGMREKVRISTSENRKTFDAFLKVYSSLRG